MLIILSKYDHTALSIPQSSQDVHPLFSNAHRFNTAVKKISTEKIIEIQLKSFMRFTRNLEQKEIKKTGAWEAINNQMKWLCREQEIIRIVEDKKRQLISSRLNKIYKSINEEETIFVTSARRYFTPWNLDSDENRLYKYDWELSDDSIPVLTDLFHFLFQSQVVLLQKEHKEIKKTISNALNNAAVKNIIEQHHINVQLHYKLYLLFSISYYLRIYINQKFPHRQIHQQIDT